MLQTTLKAVFVSLVLLLLTKLETGDIGTELNHRTDSSDWGLASSFKRQNIHSSVHEGRNKAALGENSIILTDIVIAAMIILAPLFSFRRHGDLNKISVLLL